MGRLTTHVLDTARGRPAAGLAVSLWRIDDGGRHEVARVQTTEDGRSEPPLLDGAAFTPGTYELVFAAGAWFDEQGFGLGERKFLDEVVIRFGVADAGAHLHVPLLLQPFGYSTYRGS